MIVIQRRIVVPRWIKMNGILLRFRQGRSQEKAIKGSVVGRMTTNPPER